MAKRILGLIEKVRIIGKKKSRTIEVLVDTGAAVSSLDKKIAEKVGYGDPVRMMKVRAPATKIVKKRPVVSMKIKIGGEIIETQVNLNDRSHMRYPMIIGRNVLKDNFTVDVSRSPKIRRQ